MTGANTGVVIAGRYLLGPSLGTGGMGRVWLAHDEVLRREVAIKEIALPFGLADDELEELRSRTLREARAAARLNHPNVVRIYDVFTSDEQPWIVMEYVRGRSLLQVIKEDGPLPVEQVAGLGLALLSALESAHRAGVVHRDVKPSNVLLAEDGRVVLTDFGSAVLDESEGAITRTGVIVGSPQYIAPERAFNGISTPASDLWSLGATLYAAVEGRPPYARQTAMATLTALAAKRPDPVRFAGPLKPVLSGLLQRRPQARMTATQAADRLWQVASRQAQGRLWRASEQRYPLEPVELDVGDWSPQPVSVLPPERPAATPPPPVAGPALASPTPPAPKVPSSNRRRTRRWQVATASAVAAALIGLVAWQYGVQRPPADKAAGGAGGAAVANGAASSPSPSAAGIPSAARTSSPPARPFVLPAGFAWWSHPSGFKVAIPARWEMIREGRIERVFCSPTDPSTLRVRPWTSSDPDPVAALVKAEGKARLAGYQRIRIQASPYAYAAEWEYTYADRGRRLHGIERIFLVANRAYMIQWRTPHAKWQANIGRLGVITASFKPPARPAA